MQDDGEIDTVDPRGATASWALLALLLGGCAPAELVSSKPGVTDEEFNRDNYQCVQESRTSWSGGGSGVSGGLMIIGARQNARKESQKLYTLCMKARGYTVTEKQ